MKKKRIILPIILLFTCVFLLSTPVNANSIETARIITTDQTVSGVITETEGDTVNYYQITLPSAGKLNLSITSYLARLGFRIYDSNYSSIAYDTLSWDSASKVGVGNLYYELQAGTYYIRVVGNYGDSNNSYYYGNYSFTTSFTSAGVNHAEPNNEFSTASGFQTGDTIKGHIACNNEVDYYKVTLSSAGRLKLSVTSYLQRLGFRVYDSEYNSITYDSISWDSASKVGVSNLNYDLDAGTYYIRVIGSYGDSTKSYYYGKYSLVTSFSSAGVNYKKENNSLASAYSLSLNKKIKGHIALNNTVDYYKITVPKTGSVSIKLTSALSRLGYRIYDSSYNSVTGGTVYLDNASSKTNTVIHTLSKGTYYIRVIGNYWNSDQSYYYGNYSMTVSQSNIKPAKCTITSLTKTSYSSYYSSYRNLLVKWKKISGVRGYEIKYSTSSKFANASTRTTSDNSCTIYGVPSGKTYYVKVRAYKLDSDGKKIYGTYSAARKLNMK